MLFDISVIPYFRVALCTQAVLCVSVKDFMGGKYMTKDLAEGRFSHKTKMNNGVVIAVCRSFPLFCFGTKLCEKDMQKNMAKTQLQSALGKVAIHLEPIVNISCRLVALPYARQITIHGCSKAVVFSKFESSVTVLNGSNDNGYFFFSGQKLGLKWLSLSELQTNEDQARKKRLSISNYS